MSESAATSKPRLRWVRAAAPAGPLWCAYWPHAQGDTLPIQAWVRRVREGLYVYGSSRPPGAGDAPPAFVGRASSLDEALSAVSAIIEGLGAVSA